MKVCPRCRALYGEGGKVCEHCHLKLEPFGQKINQPKNDGDVEDNSEKVLKASIPEAIKLYLELKAGDKLEWKMDGVNGIRFCTVTRKPDVIDGTPKESRE